MTEYNREKGVFRQFLLEFWFPFLKECAIIELKIFICEEDVV